MRRLPLLLAALVLTSCSRGSGESAPSPTEPLHPQVADERPVLDEPVDEPGTYLGRRIAPTMSHHGAPWLVRPERDAEEDSTTMLKELRLSPGDVVCDIGAGNGYHTLLMAEAVAPSGRAIAVDIQPKMLALLEERAKERGLGNVETILGDAADPKLPRGTCDLIFLADVYHELSDPAAMLARFREALSSKGQVALLEFRGEDPAVPIKPLHKMTKAQITKELTANGFALARAFEGLPWQHLMLFRR